MSTETFVYLDWDTDLIGVFVSDDSALDPSDLIVVTYTHSTGNTATQSEVQTLTDAAATDAVTLNIDGVDTSGAIYWMEFTDITDNPKSGLALFDSTSGTPLAAQAFSYGANTKITLDGTDPDFDVAPDNVDPLGNIDNPYTFGIDLTGIDILCFARGALIETPDGPRLIEDLSIGDWVTTQGGVAVIRWIGSVHVSSARLKMQPWLRPVRIGAGALGGGLPRRALMLSPRHGVLVADWRAALLFDAPEVIVEAIALINDRDIRQTEPGSGVEYFHILLDRHELVIAEGVPTESLFLCEASLRDLGPAARAEIQDLFPQLTEANLHDAEVAPRVGLSGYSALSAL